VAPPVLPPGRRARDAEGKEPLQVDLDARGLKAQVLERIELLEERERERQALLKEVLTVAGEHGLDGGALKAVMGG
jgi:hypothetical protein